MVAAGSHHLNSYFLQIVKDKFVRVMEKGKFLSFVVDAAGFVEYANEYVEDILHFSDSQVTGKNLQELTDPEGVRFLNRIFSDGANAEHAEVSHFALFCSYCKRHYFDGLVLPVHTDNSLKFVFYLHDVTERVLTEEKLLQSNIELDSFIYKASHDLRAPLLSVLGLINVAGHAPEDIDTHLNLMRASVNRLNGFISQLAQYSRNANQDVNFVPVLPKGIVDETISFYRFLPGFDMINFEVSITGDNQVYSDPFRLRIILNNLLSNAIKFRDESKPQSFVKINVRSSWENLYITVEDNGIGIQEEHAKNVFGMFQRFTEFSEGSGLGLYIVRKAVDQLKGKISFSSLFGSGTLFNLVIPNMGSNCERRMQFA